MDFTVTPFADATAVTPAGEGAWTGRIAPDWDILGNANGGYLLAMAGRAAAEACGRPDPVTMTGHFLAPGRPGPVRLTTEIVKEGRRFATVATTIADELGKPLLAALGSFTQLEDRPGPEHVQGGPPELPDRDACLAVQPTEAFPPPFMAQTDLRLHPDDVPFGAEGPSGFLRVRGWFRWRGDQPLDTLSLLVASDAFPPTIFNADLPVAWTPTLELTTHVRHRPDPNEWLRCSFRTRFITAGFLEEDGELWDGRGRLIAQSRQLALLPRS